MSEPTIRVKVTNSSRSPRGINTAGNGTYVVAPGSTSKEITVTEGELASMSNSDLRVEELGAGEPYEGGANSYAPRSSRLTQMYKDIQELKEQVARLIADKGSSKNKSVAEVIAMGNDNDVSLKTFKEEASKLLGDNTPTKRNEIIAALEELATRP